MAADDSSNPLFLANSDSPGIVWVSQVLDGSNYFPWKRSMSMALSAKNKLGFVNGDIAKPSTTDTSYQSWVRCNDMVCSWIINSLSKDIAASVLYIATASNLWKELDERFSQGNAPRIFQLKKCICALTQDSSSVADYFTKFKTLWDEYFNYRPLPDASSPGVKTLLEYHNQDYILHFLMGLNESFSALRGQILLSDPLPSLNKVFSMVLQEETERNVGQHTPHFESAAAMASKTTSGPYMPQRSFSSSNSFKHSSGSRKGKLYCTECGYSSHTTDKCFRLIGFPPGFKSGKGKGINFSSQVHSVASSGEQNLSSMPLTKEQYDQLLNLLKPVNPPPTDSPSLVSPHQNPTPSFQPQCNMTGPHLMDDDWYG